MYNSLCYIRNLVNRLIIKKIKDLHLVSGKEVQAYHRYPIWAEEASSASSGYAQMSFGNGSVGYIGLRVGKGLRLVYLSFHADTFAKKSRIHVDLVDYQDVTSPNSPVIASIILDGADDGGGTANNAHKLVEFSNVSIPDNAVLGFRTRSASGTISDFRVMAMLEEPSNVFLSTYK